MTRSKSARSSTAHVVASSATTDAVRGFFVSSAISPNICPGAELGELELDAARRILPADRDAARDG